MLKGWSDPSKDILNKQTNKPVEVEAPTAAAAAAAAAEVDDEAAAAAAAAAAAVARQSKG